MRNDGRTGSYLRELFPAHEMDGSDSQIHAPFKGSLRVQLQHLTNRRLAVRHCQTGETEPGKPPVDPVRFSGSSAALC